MRFPDVSGMEHLEMLCTHSDIVRDETHLAAEQRARLAEADKLLLQQACRFYQAIQRIADLEAWRRQQGIPPVPWWYLDVLAQLPDLSPQETSGSAVSA